MVVSCCVAGCTQRFREGVSFYRIPKDTDRRNKWLAAIQRGSYDEDSPWVPSVYDRVCGRHFIKEKSDDPMDPDFVPSVNMDNPYSKKKDLQDTKNRFQSRMAPLGSFYQLILTDQEQDEAIKDLYKMKSWTLHAKALSDKVVKILLKYELEEIVSFIESTIGDSGYPNMQPEYTQPNTHTAAAENMNTDELDDEPVHIQREHEHESLEVQQDAAENTNTDDFIVIKTEVNDESFYMKSCLENESCGGQSEPTSELDENEPLEVQQDAAENMNRDGYIVVKTEVNDESMYMKSYLANESCGEQSDPGCELGSESELYNEPVGINSEPLTRSDVQSEEYDSERTLSAEEDSIITGSETEVAISENAIDLRQNASDKGTAYLYRSKYKSSPVVSMAFLQGCPQERNTSQPLHNPTPSKSVVKTDFQCVHCQNYYSNSKGLRWHVSQKHPDKTPPKTLPRCDPCKREFKTRDELKAHRKGDQHRRNWKKKQTQCKQCGEYITSKKTLKLHDEIPHSEKDKFPCDICGKVFHQPRMVTIHKQQLHDETKSRCNICGKKFETMRRMVAHQVRHNEANRKHVCEHCGKSFFKRFSLIAHIMIHTGEKPYKCQFCDYRCALPGNLRKHEKNH